MKITIDREKKTIELHGSVNLNDLYTFIDESFGDIYEWKIEAYFHFAGKEPKNGINTPFQSITSPNLFQGPGISSLDHNIIYTNIK